MFAEKIHIIQKIISRFLLVTSVVVTAFSYRCECSSIPDENISVAREFIKGIELLAQMNPLPPPHPLPTIFKMADGAIITSTVRGRNLMLVHDDLGSVVIVTGSGPRYDSQEKNELKRIFNVAKVIDIVDVIPYEGMQDSIIDSPDKIRDILFIFDRIRQILELNLGSGGKVNVSQTNISVIKKLVTDIEKLDLCCNFPMLEEFLKRYHAVNAEGGLSTAGVVLGKACANAINELEPVAKLAITVIIDGMRKLAHMEFPYNNKLLQGYLCAAITALEQRTGKDLCKVVKEFVSQKTKSVAKDIGDISLDNPLQQYSLAHFLHSEQLAYVWMCLRAKNPRNYMYTQRGMCETCNPFMIRVLRTCPIRFYILSTYPAQRPGRTADLEIDGTWSVPAFDHGGQTVLINVKGTAKYLPIVRARDEKMPSVDNTGSNHLPAQDEGLQLGIHAEKEYLEFLSNVPISSTAMLADSDHETGGAGLEAEGARGGASVASVASSLSSSYPSSLMPLPLPSSTGSTTSPDAESSSSLMTSQSSTIGDTPAARDKSSGSSILATKEPEHKEREEDDDEG